MMPLEAGTSKSVISKNIEEMIAWLEEEAAKYRRLAVEEIVSIKDKTIHGEEIARIKEDTARIKEETRRIRTMTAQIYQKRLTDWEPKSEAS